MCGKEEDRWLFASPTPAGLALRAASQATTRLQPIVVADNQRDDNADTRQKNQPDSVISNGVWYNTRQRRADGNDADRLFLKGSN